DGRGSGRGGPVAWFRSPGPLRSSRRHRRPAERVEPRLGRHRCARGDPAGARVVTPGAIMRTALLIVGGAYAVTAEIVAARHGLVTTYAGASGWYAGLDFLAGFALVVAGLASWQLRPANVTGLLTVAAGFLWFAPDWIGWEGGPAGIRSAAMLLAGIWLALLVHAVLAFQQGRLPTVAARLLAM